LTYCAALGTIEYQLGESLTLNLHSEISMSKFNTVMITKVHSNFTGVKMKVNSIRYDSLSESYIYTCQAEDGFEYQFSEYDIINVD
jgi:hypothetical protein